MKTSTRFGRWWNRDGLAALLLRMLGFYFMMLAIVSGMREVNDISLVATRFGWDELLRWIVAIDSARLAAELVIGTYLVLGGQWVFNKVLAPIARRPKQDAFTDGG